MIVFSLKAVSGVISCSGINFISLVAYTSPVFSFILLKYVHFAIFGLKQVIYTPMLKNRVRARFNARACDLKLVCNLVFESRGTINLCRKQAACGALDYYRY